MDKQNIAAILTLKIKLKNEYESRIWFRTCKREKVQ